MGDATADLRESRMRKIKKVVAVVALAGALATVSASMSHQTTNAGEGIWPRVNVVTPTSSK